MSDDDYVLIPIYGTANGVKGVLVARTKVSQEDAVMAGQHRWYLSGGYAATNRPRKLGKPRIVLLHRLLLSPAPGFIVDHKNQDKLDNRRSNLRQATYRENNANVTRKVRVSGYIGVAFEGVRYAARIRVDGRVVVLKYRASITDAALDYDWAARIVHGEFAVLNFPDVVDYRPEGMDAGWLTREDLPKGRHRSEIGATGFRGVHKRRRKFAASLRNPDVGRQVHLGTFPTAEEAARRVDQYEKELYGDRAILNFPDESKEAM